MKLSSLPVVVAGILMNVGGLVMIGQPASPSLVTFAGTTLRVDQHLTVACVLLVAGAFLTLVGTKIIAPMEKHPRSRARRRSD
ncbi:hypothetical protein [Paraburkholderia sp. SIMBA_054]|uniref:hypothetical protein n=1 Tax=Paraburkholderia sp. SIMBA_054 TaxID=3085795 RepID=UPI00397C1C8B